MRREFIANLTALDVSQLVFVDEMGTHCAMALSYGWAPAGERLVSHKPKARGANVTSIGALGINGMLTLNALEERNTNPVFEEWLRQYLVPLLRPGNIVIMDNLKQHKQACVREAIERAGATVLFLPPYSPELNAIEECWSKIKNFIRRLAPRTREALHDAIRQAFRIVTAADARGWIGHAGYAVESH